MSESTQYVTPQWTAQQEAFQEQVPVSLLIPPVAEVPLTNEPELELSHDSHYLSLLPDPVMDSLWQAYPTVLS